MGVQGIHEMSIPTGSLWPSHSQLSNSWHHCLKSIEFIHNLTYYILLVSEIARHPLCCHLALLGLAQCKPGLTNWTCSGHAQAGLGGSRVPIWVAPDQLGFLWASSSNTMYMAAECTFLLAPKALARQALWRYLVLLGFALSKPKHD